MTLPDERLAAVIWTRKFLVDLLDSKAQPRVPLRTRRMALQLLRHYPHRHELREIWQGRAWKDERVRKMLKRD